VCLLFRQVLNPYCLSPAHVVPEYRLYQIEPKWDEMQVRLINATTYEAAGGAPVLEPRHHAVVNPESLADVGAKRLKRPALR
jgi:hypothetical protein